MRVILTANTSWYLYNFRQDLIRRLVAEGYTVLAVAPKDSHSGHLEELGAVFHHVSIDNRGLNPLRDFLTFCQYLALGRRFRPALWLTFTIKPVIYGTVAAFLSGAKGISTITGLGTSFLHRSQIQFVVESLYRHSQRFAAKVVFQNEEDRAYFLRKNIVPEEKALVAHGSGINIERFAYSVPPINESFRFLMIARLLWDKGIKEFIEAAEELRKADQRFIFQLAGRLEGESREAVSRRELDCWIGSEIIQYLGEVSDIRPIIRGADCVVLPSYREGLPRSLLEASSMGRPVIAADAPGSRSVVLNGYTGLLCETKSSKSLVSCMRKISEMSYEGRKKMGMAGRQFVEDRFRENTVNTIYLKTIDSES